MGEGEPTKTRQKTDAAPAAADASKSVTFPATIPPMETAVKIHGEGGARIMLDVAEINLGKFLPAIAFRGKNISVTFTEELA